MAWCRDSCSINYYENKQKLASVIHFVSLAKHKWGVIKTLGEQVYKNHKPYVLNLSSSCSCIFHSIQTGSSTAAPPPLFFFFSAAFWKPQFSTHSKPWGSAKGEEQQQRECASIFSTSTARYRNEAFYCTALRFLRKNTHTHTPKHPRPLTNLGSQQLLFLKMKMTFKAYSNKLPFDFTDLLL